MSVVLSHYVPPCQLFCHITFLHVSCSVTLRSSMSVVLSHYIPPCQLFCHITFLHVSCSVTLHSSMSVVLSHYIPPCQLFCHITFLHVSCSVILRSSMPVVLSLYIPPCQLFCHFTFHHIGFIQAFLCAFAKLRKQLLGLSCLAVHLSFGLHGTTWLPLDGFSWNLVFEELKKSVKEIQMSLKSDKNDGYLTWRRMYIYDNIRSNSCYN